MLRERFKEMDLRLTELADYLQISRPTMYKFIEYYENKEFDLINKRVLKLFNYVTENELAGKKNVVNYVLTNLVEIKDLGDKGETEVISAVKKLINGNPDSKKSKFIAAAVKSDIFDSAIFYMSDISELAGKKKLTESEQKLLQPYTDFIKKITELNISSENVKGDKNGENT